MIKRISQHLLTLAVIITAITTTSPPVQATTTGFKANEIMSDTVMTNSSSMSPSQIQNFLNSKLPTCDTNGTQLSEYGGPDLNGDGKVQRWEWGKSKYNQTTFPCLKDYTQGGKKASQIIYDVSQKYKINPQSLIALLQKEQGLVTDTWPLNIQYRSATGYGCPDTAPCDSQYYGLTNQLDWAAEMFRSIIDQNPNWYSPYIKGSNPRVYWHPSVGNYINSTGADDARSGCGYNPLNISNWTTAALYSYTPYRPNQAALNAGYGTGDSCSSYGNRNFYSYFTDWFGATSTPLFKINNEGNTVYLSYGDTYYPIPSQNELNAWGLTGKRIDSVSSNQLNSYKKGQPLSNAVKFGTSATVYLVDDAKLYPVPSLAVLGAYNYSSSNTETFEDSNLKNLLVSSSKQLTQLARKANGSIYFVSAGRKHVFPDYTTYTIKASDLTGTENPYALNLSDNLFESLTESTPILTDGSIVKSPRSATIYLYVDNSLYTYTYDSWVAWGKRINHSNLSELGLNGFEKKGNVPSYFKVGDIVYVASGKKYPVDSSIYADFGITENSIQSLGDSAAVNLPTGNYLTTLVRQTDGTIYLVRSNVRYKFARGTDFTNAGYLYSNVTTLYPDAQKTFTKSDTLVFAPGTLVKDQNGGIHLIDQNLSLVSIPTMDVFRAYGFKGSTAVGYSSDTLGDYSKSILRNTVQCGSTGSYVIADSSKRYTVDTTLASSAAYDIANTQLTTGVSSRLCSYISKPAIPMTRYIKSPTSNTVYYVENGSRRPFTSASSFSNHGGAWSEVRVLSDTFLQSLPIGTTL